MRELRRAAHTVYSLRYHFVFTTKYRKPVLGGEIGRTLRDLIREICRSGDIEILEGHIRPTMSIRWSASRPTSRRAAEPHHAGDQGESSHHLLQDHRKLRATFWGAFGYKVANPRTTTASKISD